MCKSPGSLYMLLTSAGMKTVVICVLPEFLCWCPERHPASKSAQRTLQVASPQVLWTAHCCPGVCTQCPGTSPQVAALGAVAFISAHSHCCQHRGLFLSAQRRAVLQNWICANARLSPHRWDFLSLSGTCTAQLWLLRGSWGVAFAAWSWTSFLFSQLHVGPLSPVGLAAPASLPAYSPCTLHLLH